jgi:ferredoxin
MNGRFLPAQGLGQTMYAPERLLAYLREQGAITRPMGQEIVRIDERCNNCGSCTALCPSEALCLDRNSRRVHFDQDKCIACELCLKGCPLRAMEVRSQVAVDER